MNLIEDASYLVRLMYHKCGFNASMVVSYLPLWILCRRHPIRPFLALIMLYVVLLV
jgi:hypothetical protein